MELSSKIQIGLQEWIGMMTTKMKKQMMMKHAITRPKMTNPRKNLKNKNRLTLMRLTMSSLMQERTPILSILLHMRKNHNRNSRMQHTTKWMQI
jgi:hypothetical protein